MKTTKKRKEKNNTFLNYKIDNITHIYASKLNSLMITESRIIIIKIRK
jgi:hypothetical protein